MNLMQTHPVLSTIILVIVFVVFGYLEWRSK